MFAVFKNGLDGANIGQMSHHEAIANARRNILFGNLNTAVTVGAANIIVIASLLIGKVSASSLALWLTFMIILSATQFVYCRPILKNPETAEHKHITAIIIFTFLAGLGWGFLPFMIDAVAYPISLQLVVFMLAGMTAGSALAFASHLRVFAAFNVPALSMLGLFYLQQGSIDDLAMAGVLVIYFMATRDLSHRAKKNLTSAIMNKICAEEQRQRVENQKTAMQALAENYKATAQKAEAADLAKSKFIANLSHELRAPINGVIGMLEALEKTSASDEQKEYIEIAQNSAIGLLRLVSSVHTASVTVAEKETKTNTPVSDTEVRTPARQAAK